MTFSSKPAKVDQNNTGPSRLPWWTWVLPFFIANLGTWLSIWFKTDPGASLWYLPTALGIVMVYWWGPRVLLGVYLNALVCAPLWDLPWRWSYLYALPETMVVGLSWLFFIKIAQGKYWLPDLKNVVGFLLFGSIVPTFIGDAYLVAQLYLLGDIPKNTIWDNWRVVFSSDLATQFVFAVPLLVIFTKSMREKGWTQTKDNISQLPLLPENRNSRRDIIFIIAIFAAALILIVLFSIHDLWILYGFLMILIAIRYGVNMAVISTSWIGILAFLLPVILTGKLRLSTATYGDFVSTNLDILFLCGVALLTGRAISDLFIEITERRQAEEELRLSEQRYRSLFADSPISIWEEDLSLVKQHLETLRNHGVTDFRTYFESHPQEVRQCAAMIKVIDVNKAALQMYRAQNREEMLENLGKIITFEPSGNFQEELIDIAEGRTAFHWEGTDQTLTGEPIQVTLNWSVVPGHENDYSKVIVSTINITERKRAEEMVRQYTSELEQRVKERTAELNRTNAELERANRAKDEFLANMSHELRTPLNSILGLSESLLEQRRGSLNDTQQKSLKIIESSGSHLLELISDILDFAKIEAGKFDYYPQPVSVDEVCKSSLSFVKSQAAKKSIKLNYTNEATVREIAADPRRLKQILVNLLTNAVKFTPDSGQVTLEVYVDSEQELIRFSVIDTGIGIAPHDLKRLFNPFVQVDSSLTREFEGTGLGLALVQKLTDLHGGSVHVESEVSKGSRFTINLYAKQNITKRSENIHGDNFPPLVKQAAEVAFRPNGKGTTGHHKILLAEDNVANILTVGEYLESYGYEILVAHDGLEAVKKAQAAAPDIIVMDIQMPLMNGLEATRRLRADPRFTSTPIIALTALAMLGDRERCLEAGATEYLSKPVSLKALREMIESFLA